jgi:hypothetical protein
MSASALTSRNADALILSTQPIQSRKKFGNGKRGCLNDSVAVATEIGVEIVGLKAEQSLYIDMTFTIGKIKNSKKTHK